MTDPIWHGQFNLYWRHDCFGNPDQALYIGRLNIGNLMFTKSSDRPWRMWLMTDEDGMEAGRRSMKQEARDALVDLALEYLFERTRHDGEDAMTDQQNVPPLLEGTQNPTRPVDLMAEIQRRLADLTRRECAAVVSLLERTRTPFLPCPFCGATPVTRQTKLRTDQLHGEPLQDWMIVCPKGHAQRKAPTRELAVQGWNQRI